MTNEELIQSIQDHIDSGVGEYEGYGLTLDECRKIINALKQQPCDDCISREETLKAFAEKCGGECGCCKYNGSGYDAAENCKLIKSMPSVTPKAEWIPVSERLPETDNENSINNYNVLLWVKNKSHPEREPEIYLGKLRHIDGDDGSGNFWGIEIKPCDWIIWGWSYFNEPEVIAWQPLPEPYKAESEVNTDEDSD